MALRAGRVAAGVLALLAGRVRRRRRRRPSASTETAAGAVPVGRARDPAPTEEPDERIR